MNLYTLYKIRICTAIILLLFQFSLVLSGVMSLKAQTIPESAVFRNEKLSPEVRVNDLLRRLTLQE
ncbi:MAG TPA: hypothetical protein VHK91_08180, partial [Flavisolibacter sp.]|nr:hypothetical protein [Flavisolibacter sp.]